MSIADPRSYMTYQPLLAEAAAGSLEPRHVVVPLHRTQVIKARRSTGCGCAASPPGSPAAPTTY
jgi:NADH:ubiquinone reductase (H+-translocating)